MRGKWILIAGTALLLGAGSYGVWMLRRTAAPATPPPAAAPELPPGAEVQFNGKIRAANVLSVSAPIDGVAEEFPVRPGDEVFEGQILGRIRNDNLTEAEREASLQLESAQAKLQAQESALIAARLEQSRLEANQARARGELQQKERVYQRQSLLNREGATPRRTYEAAVKDFEAAQDESKTIDELTEQMRVRIEKAISDVDQARKALEEETAQYENAKQELAAAEVHSPVDGVIVKIGKNAGDEVKRDEPGVFEIATELTSLELVVEPPPPVLKRLTPGSPALIRIAEIPGEGLPAKIKAIQGSLVVIEFASPDPVIRPGMTALAVLKLT